MYDFGKFDGVFSLASSAMKTPYQLDLEVKDRKPDIVPKAGDKVKIKSLAWYEKWKDPSGHVSFPETECIFSAEMQKECGKVFTVKRIRDTIYGKRWNLELTEFNFIPEMFEEVYPKQPQIDAVSCSASAIDDVSVATAIGYTYPSSPQGIGISTWPEPRSQITLPQNCFGSTSAVVHQDFFKKKEPELQMIKKHRFIKLEKL